MEPRTPQEPPVTPQPAPAEQPIQTSSPQQQTTNGSAKKIKNAGQSALALGILLTIISTISLLGIKSLDKDKQALAYGYILVVLSISIYWIISGFSIKKNVSNVQTAAKSIKMTAISAFFVSGITALGMAIKPGGGGLSGILALILGVYLLISGASIKKAG